jgi:hypothetical protein
MQDKKSITTITIIIVVVILTFYFSKDKTKKVELTPSASTSSTSTNVGTDIEMSTSTLLGDEELDKVEPSNQYREQPTPEKPYKYIEVINSCGIHFQGTCVNMRSGPGTSYPIVLGLRTGIVLRVSETVKDDAGMEWHKIEFVNPLSYPERVKGDLYVADPYVKVFYNEGNKVSIDKSKGPITKRIVINVTEQMLYAYDGDEIFMKELVSTGLKDTPTKVGKYSVYKKTPSRYMQGSDKGPADQYYDLPGVPWNLYFTYDGDVIHGAYWHNSFGRPWSHGCVNMNTQSAKKLYEWAVVGTPVSVVN